MCAVVILCTVEIIWDAMMLSDGVFSDLLLLEVPQIAILGICVLLLTQFLSRQRRVVGALRAERDYLETYLDTAGLIFVVIDRGQRVRYISNRGCEILGLPRSEIANRKWFDTFVPLAEREQARHAFQQMMLGETAVTEYLERPVLTRDGRERLIGWHNTLLTDARGGGIAMLRAGEDITDRKRVEHALWQSESRWLAIYSAMSEGVGLYEMIYDEAGNPIDYKILDINPAYESILGVSRRDLVGKTAAETLGGQVRHLATFAGVVQSRQPTSFETYCPTVGRHFSVSVVSPDEGQFAVVFTDITKRKRLEDALKQTEREATVENWLASVFLTTQGGETFDEVLQVIVSTTKSKHGLFGYINGKGDLVYPSMTRSVWEQSQISGKSTVFPRETWGGIWGRALTEKRTQLSNRRFRVPEGHLAMDRAMSTPIVHLGKVIGLITVANKPTDYDQDDQNLLEAIAAYLAPILNARLSQVSLEEAREHRADETHLVPAG